jgi:hypothetical protein
MDWKSSVAAATVVGRMSTCDFTKYKPAAAKPITPRMPTTAIPTMTQTQVLILPAMSPSAI